MALTARVPSEAHQAASLREDTRPDPTMAAAGERGQ